MNILLLTTRLNLGGIGIYTVSLAKSLKQRGENIFVASSGGELVDELKNAGIEHIYISIDTSSDIGLHTLTAYLKLLRIIRERGIEIIHAQTRVAQVIAFFLSRQTGVPFVSTCHGFFKRRISRRIFPCWGERVIAISDAVREHLVNDMKVAKENIRLIYNGIDIEESNKHISPQEKALIRKEYGLKDGPTIGIISRLSKVKGHRYLFGAFAKALEQSSNLQLLVVGDGPVGYVKELKSLVKRLGLEEKVIFRKACRDTSIPLSVIDIFCLPSLQEGLGLSILEAMAAGVPVVASDVGGIYTLIKDKHNGLLVAPKDEAALAEAMLEILSNPSMAKDMGDLSKKIVREKFSLAMMTDKVSAVYKELID